MNSAVIEDQFRNSIYSTEESSQLIDIVKDLVKIVHNWELTEFWQDLSEADFYH